MAVVGVVIDGKWTAIDDGRPVNHVVDVSITDMDQIVRNFAQCVQLAQGLSDDDQRRVRDFARACLATLEATTMLPKSDQARFQRSLRGGPE